MNFRLNLREGQFGRANSLPKRLFKDQKNKHGWIEVRKEMNSRNWDWRD